MLPERDASVTKVSERDASVTKVSERDASVTIEPAKPPPRLPTCE